MSEGEEEEKVGKGEVGRRCRELERGSKERVKEVEMERGG